jgi:hypothetical protein
MRRYPMSLSAGVKWVTGLVVLLLCATPVVVWRLSPAIRIGGAHGPAGPFAQGIALWGTLLAPVIALGCWALSPKAIEVEGGELRVLRRAWRAAAWPLSRVDSVSVLPPRYLMGSVRTFGNGGLFGFYGWFYKKGAFRLFATRTDRLVEVVIDGKRVVVSPDEPARLVEGLLSAAPRARSRQPGETGAASASRTS